MFFKNLSYPVVIEIHGLASGFVTFLIIRLGKQWFETTNSGSFVSIATQNNFNRLDWNAEAHPVHPSAFHI